MHFAHKITVAMMLTSGAVNAASTTSIPEISEFAHLAQGLWQGEVSVTVKKGDTLLAIVGRYATTPNLVAKQNAILPNSRLRIGQVIKIQYSHLIPADLTEGITINLPQRLLFVQQAGVNTHVYALGLGRPSWPTPTGAWKIINKVDGKTWVVPKSIQVEMAREGLAVKTRVPPGPNNPLGRYWLGLSLSGYGIHGTLAPASIYRFQSHGCIRLYVDDIADLYSKVDKGVIGFNHYWPILLQVQSNGHVLLEVQPDIYQHRVNAKQALQQLVDTQKITAKIDWILAEATLNAATGTPVDITL